jgi:hypothetical protein
MSIFNELEQIILNSKVILKEEFEMEPSTENEDKYDIFWDTDKVCSVEIINQLTDKSEDMELAQKHPENFIVYLSDVKNQEKAEEYKAKLEQMGFENISIEQEELVGAGVEMETEGTVTEAKHEDVISMYLKSEFPTDKLSVCPKSSNLRITKMPNGNWALINYATPMLYRNAEGKLFLNTTKYSQSTSAIQSQINRTIGDMNLEYGKDVIEVKEEQIAKEIYG